MLRKGRTSFSSLVSSSSALTKKPETQTTTPFFEHKFRCPLCRAGNVVRFIRDGHDKNNNNNNNKSSEADNTWLTGKQLDKHLKLPYLHRVQRRTFFAERTTRRNLQQKAKDGEGNGNKNNSNKTDDISNDNNNNNNNNNPYFTFFKFKRELHAALHALPRSSLLDRVLVIDVSNSQLSRTFEPGMVRGAAMAHDLLWGAFKKKRIAVVFVHEHHVRYSAPIFNYFGAMAEGSANVHDGGRWFLRGMESRLLFGGRNDDDDDHAAKKSTVLKKSVFESATASFTPAAAPPRALLEQAQHPYRPWNSITIPTMRGIEAGDLAVYRTVKKLHDLLAADENKEELMITHVDGDDDKQKLAKRKTTTGIDVLTFDAELAVALKAAVGASGRLNIVHDVVDFASAVLREEE